MRVALIGVGMVGGTYATALAGLKNTVCLHGVLGRSERSGRAFLDRQTGVLPADAVTYRSIEEVAQDRAVDFAILATPPDARLDLVRTLAGAGKPILMEKPVERTLAAAREICRVCEAAGVPLGIVLQTRASASARILRDRLQAGGFGMLHMAEISVPWWRDQIYYDTPGRGTHLRDGGGVMITQAIHVLDLALQFTGPISDVVALAATTGFHTMEAEDFVSAGLRFRNGAVGTMMTTTASFPGRPEQIVLHYANASVQLQRGSLRIDWRDGRAETLGAVAASGAGADPMAFSADLHRKVIADFAACVEGDGAPLASGRSALAVHALIEALERSGRSGKREEVADG